MEQGYWAKRWAAQQIGFHQGKPNMLLTENVGFLEGKKRVLVPLCGKAVDLRYIADRGHEVVGVELVADAVSAFFAEQQIVASAVRVGPYEGLTGGGITLLVGDFFLGDHESLGTFDALYDRAALVALDAETRVRYAAHCLSLLEPSAHGLVITFEYDATQLDGPPFSVTDEEVHTLYPGCDVKMVRERIEIPSPRFVDAGIDDTIERVYTLRKR